MSVIMLILKHFRYSEGEVEIAGLNIKK